MYGPNGTIVESIYTVPVYITTVRPWRGMRLGRFLPWSSYTNTNSITPSYAKPVFKGKVLGMRLGVDDVDGVDIVCGHQRLKGGRWPLFHAAFRRGEAHQPSAGTTTIHQYETTVSIAILIAQ